MEQNSSFTFTYSAKEKNEILSIRKKYGLETEISKEAPTTLEQLRALDRSTMRPGLIAGIAIGTIGTLVMGTGMSMAMVWSDSLFAPGILVGVIGIAGVAAAYPLYKAITNRKKKQNAAKINELTDRMLHPEADR